MSVNAYKTTKRTATIILKCIVTKQKNFVTETFRLDKSFCFEQNSKKHLDSSKKFSTGIKILDSNKSFSTLLPIKTHKSLAWAACALTNSSGPRLYNRIQNKLKNKIRSEHNRMRNHDRMGFWWCELQARVDSLTLNISCCNFQFRLLFSWLASD